MPAVGPENVLVASASIFSGLPSTAAFSAVSVRFQAAASPLPNVSEAAPGAAAACQTPGQLGRFYSFVFNCASFAVINVRISSDMSSSSSHCSLYKVTAKRPIPRIETAPFSLIFIRIPVVAPLLRAAFSLRRRSSSAFRLRRFSNFV